MRNAPKISVLTSLYHCEQFLREYFHALATIEGKDQIEILLLHNAPQETELAVIAEYLPTLDYVRHIIIPERETLYRTWNRGIQLSEGEYITVWNVDDVRFPESIIRQAEALDRHPDAAIAYGDIWLSDQYGVRGTKKTNTPIYNPVTRKEFLSKYSMSCFQMWRRSIHSIVGYYDEQFKCVADFDFQIKTALHFPFVKTKEPLGIYLEHQPHKLSSDRLQPIERNIVCLRYANYWCMNIFLLPEAKKKYRRNQMLIFDEWRDFMEKAPSGWYYRFRGIIRACFDSSYWLCRQTAKRIIFAFKY